MEEKDKEIIPPVADLQPPPYTAVNPPASQYAIPGPGNPPQKADYYAGYPPQGTGYPPQQAGYPPQGTGYLPQQAGYPPQGYYQPGAGYSLSPQAAGFVQPAPYYPQANAAQQSSNNVIVVQQQPTVATTTVIRPTGDYYYTLSLVMTFICLFCGTWWSLLCTIPAIFFASSARNASARGDVAGARSNGGIALGLNIAAVVFYFVILGIIVGVSASTISRGLSYYSGSYSYCYYSYYYYSYYCSYG